MGQFDIFRKKDDLVKSGNDEDYPKKFIEYYLKIHKNNIEDPYHPIFRDMFTLLRKWNEKFPDDANLHLATLIMEEQLNLGKIDVNEHYGFIMTNLKPQNQEYHLYLMQIIENLIKKDDDYGLNKQNFKYLDELIHSGSDEILLDTDILLHDEESQTYSKGIKLDRDGLVIDGQGHTIDAGNKTPIFKVFSKNIVLKNIKFANGYSKGNGGALYAKKNTSLKLYNVSFENNHSDNVGGAIYNWGEIAIDECSFKNNSAKKSGGAINSQNGILNISNSEFSNNISPHGGAIISFAEVKLKSCKFHDNLAEHSGGAINCQKGILDIADSRFRNNLSVHNGGAIFNFGKMTSRDSFFIDNTAKISGGAVNNQTKGSVSSSNDEYDGNDALDGGAIFNLGYVKLNNAHLDCNYAKFVGGGIYLNYSSTLISSNSRFDTNECGNEGSGIFNKSKNVKIINCEFSYNENTPIFNEGNSKFINCIFTKNKCKNVIFNDEDSLLNIIGGKIAENNISESAVCNNGKFCSIDKTVFEDNESNHITVWDIINETYLSLNNPKFKTYGKRVWNNKKLDAKKMSHADIQTFIETGENSRIYVFSRENKSIFNFTSLNNLIHESDDDKIIFKEDVVLDRFELDFFEGGIEIDRDNLTIDGNGHAIKANNLSRIFNITGKNITIKNLTFKEGSYLNNFEEVASGGGTIKIAKGSEVKIINCKFFKGYSDDNAGAILNNGKLVSKNNEFRENHSKNYGGAIVNNGLLASENDQFKYNQADFAGAIYNNGELNVKNIEILQNNSYLSKPIYNADSIHSPSNIDEFVYNANWTDNNKSEQSKSFTYLKDITKDSNHVQLKQDIIFDFRKDFEIERIDINHDLIIEGNGFSIDANHASSFFNINANITLRNIVFKNAYSKTSAIMENNADATFEDCKFLNNMATTDNHLIINNKRLKIINSSISNNSSKNKSIISNNGSLEIDGVSFINNRSRSEGGLINNASKDVETSISNSDFIFNNSKNNGGAIFNGENSSIKITNSQFIANSSSAQGGVIFNFGKIDLKNNLFQFNHTRGPGGAVYSQNGHLNIMHCEFSNNTAEYGGAIGNFSKIDIKDTIFIKNSAKLYGGAINNQNMGVIDLLNSQFILNTAKMGGAIYSIDDNSVNLENCEFLENDPDNGLD